MTKIVEEGSFVTLPCLSEDKHDEYNERKWYNGWFNKTNSPEESDILFRQHRGGDIVIGNGTLDMSINKDNFSLSIDPAKLKDDGTYTCYVYAYIPLWPDRKIWDHIELQVYSEYGDLSLSLFHQNANIEYNPKLERFMLPIPAC